MVKNSSATPPNHPSTYGAANRINTRSATRDSETVAGQTDTNRAITQPPTTSVLDTANQASTNQAVAQQPTSSTTASRLELGLTRTATNENQTNSFNIEQLQQLMVQQFNQFQQQLSERIGQQVDQQIVNLKQQLILRHESLQLTLSSSSNSNSKSTPIHRATSSDIVVNTSTSSDSVRSTTSAPEEPRGFGKFPKFNGAKDDDIDEWLEDFEVKINSMPYNESQKIILLRSKLGGAARKHHIHP
jgi:hypothetical protein